VVSDGWSMAVLVREVSALYRAFSRGEEPRLPELPVQYADYASWQRDWLSGATLEAADRLLAGALAGRPPLLEIPTDRPRSPGGARAREPPLRAPAAAVAGAAGAVAPGGDDAVHDAAGRLAGAALQYSGQDDVVVGSPIAGRTGARRRG
jgi:hypothetical protein